MQGSEQVAKSPNTTQTESEINVATNSNDATMVTQLEIKTILKRIENVEEMINQKFDELSNKIKCRECDFKKGKKNVTFKESYSNRTQYIART